MKNSCILFILILFSINTFSQILSSSPGPLDLIANSYKSTSKSDMSTVLYSQMDINPNHVGIVSQEFPAYSDCRLQSADDFSVPVGGWNIGSVDAYGFLFGNGSEPVDSFIIEIFEDDNDSPSLSPLYSQDNLSYIETNGIYEISLDENIILSEGVYWISIIANMAILDNNQWAWYMAAAPQKMNEYHIIDPCNINSSWPASWENGSTHNTWPSIVSFDLCFALNEGITPVIPLSDNAIYLFGFLIIGTTLFRFFK